MAVFFSIFLFTSPIFAQEPQWRSQEKEALPVAILLSEDYSWSAQDSLMVEEALLEIQTWFYQQTNGWTLFLEEPATTLRRISAFPLVDMDQLEGEEEKMAENTYTEIIPPKANPPINDAPSEGTMAEADWTWWYRVREAYFQERVGSPRRPRVIFSSLADTTLGGEKNGLIILSREVLDGITGRDAPKGRSYYLGVIAHEILHAADLDHPESEDGSLLSIGHGYFPYTYLSRESMAAFIASPYVGKISPRITQASKAEELFLHPYFGIRQHRGIWEIFDLQGFRWLPATEVTEEDQRIVLNLGEKTFVFYRDTLEFWLQEDALPQKLATLHPHPWVQFERDSTPETEDKMNSTGPEFSIESGM